MGKATSTGNLLGNNVQSNMRDTMQSNMQDTEGNIDGVSDSDDSDSDSSDSDTNRDVFNEGDPIWENQNHHMRDRGEKRGDGRDAHREGAMAPPGHRGGPHIVQSRRSRFGKRSGNHHLSPVLSGSAKGISVMSTVSPANDRYLSLPSPLSY